jgi:uncharacterized protein YjgD (DUF1641 family)
MEDLEAKLTALEERLARIEATLNQIHPATLGQAMGLVEFMQAALTDEMVRSLAGRVETLASVALDSETIVAAEILGQSFRETRSDPAAAGSVGLFGAARKARDPDIERALGFLLVLARHLGKNMD